MSVTETGGTVGKALDVLDQVAQAGKAVRFTRLLEDSPFPKATLYRLLQTLVGQGMLHYEPEQQVYSLGIRLVKLAHSCWKQNSLIPIARPHIDTLAEELDTTIHLAQLESGQVLYLDKRSPPHSIEMFSQAGKVGPGYCTGVGKAMLAFLDDVDLERALQQQSFYKFTENTITTSADLRQELLTIRQTGISFDREEHEVGIICVAVPILSSTQKVIGALSVTNSNRRSNLDAMEMMAESLLTCASNIAREAEMWRFPEHPNS